MGTTTDPFLARVTERQRAVALARHFREAEGLSIAQIGERLGRAPASVKGYFYDPTGAKARAVKARYMGVCRGCGAPTTPRNGKGDAYAYCKRCHPGAIAPQWTRERVLEAMRAWRARYGAAPSSYDWSRTHARTPARRRSAQTTTSRQMAHAVHCHRSLRELGEGPRRRAPLASCETNSATRTLPCLALATGVSGLRLVARCGGPAGRFVEPTLRVRRRLGARPSRPRRHLARFARVALARTRTRSSCRSQLLAPAS
jgi:hypothetical protein